jgi:hypothetical protein
LLKTRKEEKVERDVFVFGLEQSFFGGLLGGFV